MKCEIEKDGYIFSVNIRGANVNLTIDNTPTKEVAHPKISDVKIWPYVLTHEEMEKEYKKKKNKQPKVIYVNEYKDLLDGHDNSLGGTFQSKSDARDAAGRISDSYGYVRTIKFIEVME